MRNSINIRSTLSLSQGTLYCILYTFAIQARYLSSVRGGCQYLIMNCQLCMYSLNVNFPLVCILFESMQQPVATSIQSTPRPKNTLPKSRVSKTQHKQFPIPDTTILNIYLPHFYFEPSQKVAYLIEKEYLDQLFSDRVKTYFHIIFYEMRHPNPPLYVVLPSMSHLNCILFIPD